MFTANSSLGEYRKAVRNLIDNNALNLDPLFGDFFTVFNLAQQDAISIFSCQGHPEEVGYSDGYIAFVCNDRGKQAIEEAFDIYFNQSLKTHGDYAYQSTLEITYSIDDNNKPVKCLVWRWLGFDGSAQGLKLQTQEINLVLNALRKAFNIK